MVKKFGKYFNFKNLFHILKPRGKDIIIKDGNTIFDNF